jgi:predicted permease
MLRDFRFAVQIIAKERWYSAVAVIALALGIGLNATVFTLVNAVLIRGLPFKDSWQLFMLGSQLKGKGSGGNVSLADLADWRAQAHSFTALGGFAPLSASLSDDRSAPQEVQAVQVTANTFSILSQPPLLGRDFAPGEDRTGAEGVAILGYTLWKTRYASDTGIIGHSIRVNGTATTVIGVMPDGMRFPTNADMWIALVPTAEQQSRSARFVQAFGRLRGDFSRAQAQIELNGIAARLAETYPDTNKDFGSAWIETFNDRFNGGPIRVVFLSMMGAVGFVLLIACANVANLQLSRSVQRSREVAIRMALGATRWRVVRQLLVESVVLGFLGGGLGLVLAIVGVRLFDRAVQDVGKPYWIVFSMDYTVFGFLAAVCAVTGILFGLAPALQVSRTNVNEILKEGGRGNAGGVRARWMTGTMVVLELVLTLVLLVGAGLMVRCFLKLYSLDLGIKTDHLMTMRLGLPGTKYPTADARLVFYDHLAPRLKSIPGVESVSYATSIPPFGAGTQGVDIEGRPPRKPDEQPPEAGVVTISPDFFDTVGVQLRRGRSFTETDGAPGSENVIINEKLAAQLFPKEDPIGRRIKFTSQPGPGQPAQMWRTIIGVSPTLRHIHGQSIEPMPVAYVPHRQTAGAFTMLLVRSRLDPAAVMNAVRREVQAVDQDQPVFTVQTVAQLLAQQTWPYRVFGTLFAIFALIALVMSAVGLYAVMAYSVTQRTAEIGVRMALGAEARQVAWLVLKRGLLQAGLGLSIGLVGAFFLSKVMQALLIGITPNDPITFAAITIVLGSVAVAACLLPSHRATRVDPLVALRAE